MRHLKGTLETLGFGNLLQNLVSNHMEGTLTVTRGAEARAIHVSRSGIRLAAGPRTGMDRLGHALRRCGVAEETQVREILAHQRASGGLLGQILLAGGMISADELTDEIREQAEEQIYEVMEWEGASFEFAEGPALEADPDPRSQVRLDLNVVALTLEAARRADELKLIRRVVASDRFVPTWICRPDLRASFDIPTQWVLAVSMLINDERTVEDVVTLSPVSRHRTLWTLYTMAQAGHIKLHQDGKTALRSSASTKEAPAGRGILLLLSSMPTFRMALATILRTAHFQVVDGAFTDQSLEVCRRRLFDAVLLDLAPTTEIGLDFCGRLSAATEAPIVVMAPHPSTMTIKAALRAGAKDYVVKPFEDAAIVSRLEALLRSPVPAR